MYRKGEREREGGREEERFACGRAGGERRGRDESERERGGERARRKDGMT